MRKYFNHIAIVILLVTTVSSCKKWLDVTPGNQVRAEDQFTSEAGFRDALMGVYLTMTEKPAYGMHASWGSIDYLVQPYRKVPGFSDFFEIQNHQYNTTGGMQIIEGLWKGNYNSIANVNSMLENMEKKKGIINPISFSIMKGELLGLRAFLHFDLLRMFGRSNYAGKPELASKLTVPYVTRFTKELTPQQSYANTFLLIEKDITDALELLQEDPVFNKPGRPAGYYDEVNRTGFFNDRSLRMNYYSVKALQARVFQWQGSAAKMLEAAKAAEDVITHSFATLNRADAPVKNIIFKSEHLFALNIDRFYDLVNFYMNPNYGSTLIDIYEADVNNIYEDNTPAGLADFRKQNWFVNIGNTDRSAFPKKLMQDINDAANRNRMPVIRLSEMYYIAAEAYLQTNLSLSIDYLNTVRRSKGIIDDIAAGADQNTVTAEITKEYRKDFIQEGQLFFYYKRKGLTNVYGIPPTTVVGDQIYMLPYPNSETETGTREQ